MTNWKQYLVQQGICKLDSENAEMIHFDKQPDLGAMTNGFVVPLTGLGLIEANGDDAVKFLHGQLTNDVEHLEPGRAQLAGYCSPKGRLLATFLTWKRDNSIFLQLPLELQSAIQKRLQMYVMRAKVKLNDATDEGVLLGLGGMAAGQAIKTWFPVLPATPGDSVDSEAGSLIRLADAFGAARYQWVTSQETAMAVWPALTVQLTPAGFGVWQLAQIQAGVPELTLATQEQFVPQMVNFEVIGGVNFKKGCYPGQEIVARSQYLGKLKRRMVPATVGPQIVTPGMEVFSSSDPEQPCGMIVSAADNLKGGVDCLVEIKLAALEAAQVHLGSSSGAILNFTALPYALP